MTQLSEHFQLSEFTASQTAARLGIPNVPGEVEIAAMRLLCTKVLEPVREFYQRPVIISSGYRAPAVNRAAGGSKTSQHMLGQAADIEIPGVANRDLAEWMHAHLNYDQLIAEFVTRGDPTSGWVHVSYREPYRNQELTARRVRKWGRLVTEYVTGLRYD